MPFFCNTSYNERCLNSSPKTSFNFRLSSSKLFILDTIPVIIDFGRSNLNYKGNLVCSMEETINDQYFKNTDSSRCNQFNPFYDLLLFVFTLLTNEINTPSYLNIVNHCLSFFMTESNFPIIPISRMNIYKQYIQYIVNQIPNWGNQGWGFCWDLVYGTRHTYMSLIKLDPKLRGFDLRSMWDEMANSNKNQIETYLYWCWNKL